MLPLTNHVVEVGLFLRITFLVFVKLNSFSEEFCEFCGMNSILGNYELWKSVNFRKERGQTGKETLALILANFIRLPAAANRLNIDRNSVTRRVVLISENAALGLFWNKATKIKTKISM